MKLKNLPLLLVALAFAHPASAANTLLDLTHNVSPPARLSESVVIIIDAQREYVDGRLPLSGVADALRQTARLLQRARATGTPIIHIQQISAPGRGVFEPGSAYTDIASEASPRPDELVITKTLPNAFAHTPLETELKKIGRRKLILSGYMTHMCISATARAALDLGYPNTIVADACATRDLPDIGGRQVLPAETVHRVALSELADRFSTVVATLDQISD